jgi:predicted O-methyltransferase YrrM
MPDGSIVHEANAARSVDPARELDAILSVFAALGYPREVVTQWSLPSSDVADLVRLAAESGARRVLEVGSFVGTSAFLMARALPEAEIHSVDPNLPLDVEFTAMGSADRGADLARRTLEIARESARRLALDGRVHFHEGGFAVGATFALADVAIPVIGPDLCARQGPFDFAFIDGLHFEDAVEADIALTLAHMTPDGVVALHDAIGYWGSHVRRAVHRILERDPSLSFTHAPYLDLYRGIGTLARTGRATPPLEARAVAAFGDLGALTEHLARLLRTTFPRARFDARDPIAQAIAVKIGDGGGHAADGPRVVLAFDAIDGLAPTEQHGALARLLEGADAAVLGFSPPGEDGAAPAWARPLATRVALLASLGFDALDLVYPFLEPYTHPYGGTTALTRKTSAMLDAVVAVRRGSSALGARALSVRAEPLTEASARALTDMRLQLLYGVRCFAAMRSARDGMDAAFAKLRDDHERQSALHADRAELLAHWTAWRVHIGRFHFWRRPNGGG